MAIKGAEDPMPAMVHAALSEQVQPSPYKLRGTYYLKDREAGQRHGSILCGRCRHIWRGLGLFQRLLRVASI